MTQPREYLYHSTFTGSSFHSQAPYTRRGGLGLVPTSLPYQQSVLLLLSSTSFDRLRELLQPFSRKRPRRSPQPACRIPSIIRGTRMATLKHQRAKPTEIPMEVQYVSLHLQGGLFWNLSPVQDLVAPARAGNAKDALENTTMAQLEYCPFIHHAEPPDPPQQGAHITNACKNYYRNNMSCKVYPQVKPPVPVPALAPTCSPSKTFYRAFHTCATRSALSRPTYSASASCTSLHSVMSTATRQPPSASSTAWSPRPS